MGLKQSKLLTEKLNKSRNTAPTTLFSHRLSKNNCLSKKVWNYLCLVGLDWTACTHTYHARTLTRLHLMQCFILEEMIQKVNFIYICIYIHLLSSLIFCLRSSAQQPSQRHRVLYVSWCWLSSVFHTPFFPSAFKVFSSGSC